MKNRLIGKYGSKNNPNKFEFKSDSTFLNEYSEGHLIKYCVGKWKRNVNKTIILTTTIKSTLVPIIVDTEGLNKSGLTNLEIHIKIVDGLDLANYHCFILYNHLDFFKVRCDSISTIHFKSPIDSLYFTFTRDVIGKFEQDTYALKTEKLVFNPTLKHNINIQVVFNDSLFYYHAFDNVLIRQRKNGIEIYNNYLKRWDFLKKIANKEKLFYHFDD